ncbi:hypothetical protein ACFLW6_02470 [Chloroflexota bacterium]
MSARISSLDDFLALLKGVKTGKDGEYKALCPGHNDRRPSLSITEADGKILVKCFAGCGLADILRPLHLEPKDLFLNGRSPKGKHKKKLVATFSYEVEKGKEAFQIRRYDLGNREKTFEAWHKTNDRYVAGILKKGEYVPGMGKYKDKPILYHLPEIEEWIATGKCIYIPEGEGKADLVIKNGGAATTSPFGASHNKWRRQYSDTLAGAKVIILSDNDKPGQDFAQEKAVSLHGKAASVKVMDLPGLPEKGDIVDWFHDGHTFKELEQMADSCSEYEPPPDTRLPEIIVNDRHLRDITADALHALYEKNKPERIFRRSSTLTRISVDEKGRPFTEVLSESAFRGYLERAANFIEIDAEGTPHPIPPPLTVVRDSLALGEWQFQPLLGVTEVPVMRPDGSVLTEPGYDSATNLYYCPAPGLSVPPIPDKPKDSEIKAAIELVLEPVYDFPFDSEASQANAMGTLFIPILRPMIDGSVPLALFDKPQQGTGASLLAEVISIINTGRAAAMMTARKDDEEWRKAITSLLLRGLLVAVIDNIEGTLYAPSLAAILTATTFQDRILGRSELVTLPNRTTWIGTGNNIRLTGDLPRRCIWVRMDAGMARPWLRDASGFKHPHLIQWVSENRGAILAAILTIARAWALAGMPSAQGLPTLGGYESYCRVVGGILSFMGVEGFLANLHAMYDETDIETPQWQAFLEALHEIIGDKPVTAAELISYLNSNTELRASLPDSIADTEGKTYSVRLGQKLGKKNGVRYPNGFVLVKAGEKKRAVTWKVARFQNETSPNFSFKGEVGEVIYTPAYTREETPKDNKRNINIEEVATTSPNLTLASEKGEVAPDEASTTKEFIPTDDWQEVPSGTAVPPGLEIRMDFESGRNYARKPSPTDRREVGLDMTIDGALKLWRAEGAPVIHLGPGENCLDLEKLLSHPDIADRHLEAIKAWLQKHKGSEQC